MEHCVLLKYGEMALKGRNARRFANQLVRNLRRAVSDLGGGVRLEPRAGLLVISGAGPSEELTNRARDVMGISAVQPAVRVAKTPEAAADAAVALVRERLNGSSTPSFAVRARRRDKRFPMNSETFAAFLGARIKETFDLPVNLSAPDLEVSVEVDAKEIFLSTDRFPGQGGLPVGISGRAVVLLSGGFDSPVAAYRAMRRGLRCDFVHFTGAPLTGPSSAYKAYALVRQLDRFQHGSRLYVIPMGHAQRELATAGAGELQIVAQRRLMLRTAEALAKQLGAQALVTGDSLGQVSSQTLSNLATVQQATSLLVLRPLVGFDKIEIIEEARRIGTAEISTLPDEDCCSLLTPPHVATSSRPEDLERLEARVDADATVARLLEHAQLLRPEAGANKVA